MDLLLGRFLPFQVCLWLRLGLYPRPASLTCILVCVLINAQALTHYFTCRFVGLAEIKGSHVDEI